MCVCEIWFSIANLYYLEIKKGNMEEVHKIILNFHWGKEKRRRNSVLNKCINGSKKLT